MAVNQKRWAFDNSVLRHVLGLSDTEQVETYEAVVDLVKTRIERPNTVKSGRKKTGGIDTVRIAENVLAALGGDTLASFVRDKLSGRDDLTGHAWKPAEPVSIDKDLYGWFVVVGKDKVKGRIECGSEAEARYLATWAETGAEAALVPEDLYYLESILPNFIKLKERIAAVIDDYTCGIIDQRLRAKIVAVLWERVRIG